ncbi:hypothetical protein [Spirulina sp. 06S082]|uniref:hypothetical protein n=1 Tax=Spirulina sp. 06S082 TaxID=3110248 RepID=UPI002B218301|nr:hypothetical protein [Spirulina sp. 06S082]MEA5471541.1 hypothetical protein [Spirulina sp. 06S082]
MLPRFSSYKINPKHRASRPSQTASVWKVPEWNEVQLFGIASTKDWYKDGILWAVMKKDSKISKIGEDLENDLCIAKYRCDSNSDWHGYPVHPKDDDIPPDLVLELWRKENLIDKRDKRRIQQGKFSI